MSYITIGQAYEQFKECVLPFVFETYGKDDTIATEQEWSNYTDSLCNDGEITQTQYSYCPAFEDYCENSNSLADEIEYYLDIDVDKILEYYNNENVLDFPYPKMSKQVREDVRAMLEDDIYTDKE